MNIELLRSFLGWCIVLNMGLYLFWVLVLFFCRDLVYRIQGRFFKFTHEQFDLVFYGFLGVYKIFLIFFNIIPWLALMIMG